MTIDKHCGQDDQMIHFSGSLADAHSLSALEQSAHYAAQLAIARWINASAQSPLPPAAPAQLARATWYAQAQQNFQEWLGLGGFAQYDDLPCAEWTGQAAPTEPAAKPAPASGAHPIGTCIDQSMS
jgi:hypothetical protein